MIEASFIRTAHSMAATQAFAAGVELTSVLMHPSTAQEWGCPTAAGLPVVHDRSMMLGSVTFRADCK